MITARHPYRDPGCTRRTGLAVMTDSAEVNKPAADPLVGRTVAQYAIVAKLGGGGMGVVYTAKDTKLGRLVALKFLPPQWSHDETAKQRFIREAQAASATDHRNICTIHNIESTDDGQLFIVMAHYDGETLKRKLEAGALGVDDALEIAAQVAEGLAKAHAQGVVHRDIKPGNLMITEDCVKILDFGLAKFADALQLTIVGSTLGTVAYMSPEQARGEDADVRSDVWALGVVLYEMLTGQVPFKGAYAEAISYAIRSDPPPPLSTSGREIPEAVERLVLRALEKDPAQRFQTARDLARDLRLLQGRSLPLDLRTEPLPQVVGTPHATLDSRRHAWKRLALACAAVLVAAIAGTYLWLTWPVDRIPVVIAPVANQTGYAELDAYRLALTQELVAQLAEARSVRVLPYDRLLQIVRRFRVAGQDISSREVMQALAMRGGSEIIIAPTLLYENGAWKARVEFRSAKTATNDATGETAFAVSSLTKETVYGLMAPLAEVVEEYFEATGPRKARVAATIRNLMGRAPMVVTSRLRTLDAAAAFEQGLDMYDQQEYAAALHSFTAASEQDARNPLLFAWRSRVALLMRRDDDAAKLAQEALQLVTDQTPPVLSLFVDAIAAEARRDYPEAEARYRELATRFPDEPAWMMELAALQDRRAVTTEGAAEAIASYLEALRLDSRVARAHLELCRLYGPARQNERADARDHGQRALAAYRALGDRGGEAHALMCLTEMLRVGRDEDRREARRNADAALNILNDLRFTYSLPRGEFYVAMAAAAQGNIPEAAGAFEKALASARSGENRVLEPLLLMNLGVAAVMLGNRSRAVEYYRQSSELYEALGDERRAAEQQANSAALRIEHGDQPADALREIQNALGVFRKLGDKNFEVFCLKMIAAYYQQVGRHPEAVLALNQAIAIARERNLEDEIASLTIDLARSRIEEGDYPTAIARLLEALGDGSGPNASAARIHLGRVRTRLGEVAAADAELGQASRIARGSDLLPLLDLVRGELAYETGRLSDARLYVGRAAARITEDLPDAASIEARAYLGLLDALAGRPAEGRTGVQLSLEQARRMARFALEARCRLFLAQIDLAQRRFDQALGALDGIPPDSAAQTIGPELRAQVHYWRSQALAGRGDRAGAQTELGMARQIVEKLRASLSEEERAGFSARPDIRRIIG